MAEKRALVMPWKQWIRSRALRQLRKNARYVKSECALPKIAPSPARGGEVITHPLTANHKNVQTLTACGTICKIQVYAGSGRQSGFVAKSGGMTF